MAWKDAISWGGLHQMGDAPLALDQQMNRLLDNVGSGFPAHFGWPGTWPHLKVSDNDKEITVVAKLPGFEENDVEIRIHDGGLTLKGNKKAEENGNSTPSRKRTRRQFQRWLKLRCEVEPTKVNTSFKNGVLTVTLAKRAHP